MCSKESFVKRCVLRLFKIFFVIFALSFSLGCEKASKEKVTLLLDWLPNPNHVPLFVGQELGYFKEEGIDLEVLKLLDPPSAIPYLQSGKVDLIVYYMPYALMALAQEKNLRALGVLIAEPLDGIICLSSEEEDVVKSFKDKSLGMTPGSRMAKYLESIFQEQEIVFADTKKIGIEPTLALMTGLVDAVAGVYWNIEPFQLEGLKQKTSFIKLSDLGLPHYHELIFVTRDDVLSKRPDLKSHFQRALQKSHDFCKSHPEEAFAFYLKQCKGKSASAKAWEEKAWSATVPLLPSDQNLDPDLFTLFIHWLEERELIKKKEIDADLFLSNG